MRRSAIRFHTEASPWPGSNAISRRAEVKKHTADLKRVERERDNLLAALGEGSEAAGPIAQQIAKADAQCQKLKQRLDTVQQELATLEQPIDEASLTSALFAFGPVWDELFQQERERLVRLVVERVGYDGPGEALRGA